MLWTVFWWLSGTCHLATWAQGHMGRKCSWWLRHVSFYRQYAVKEDHCMGCSVSWWCQPLQPALKLAQRGIGSYSSPQNRGETWLVKRFEGERDWGSRLHSRFWMFLFLCPLFNIPLIFFCIIADWFMAFPGVLLVLQTGERIVSASYGEEVYCWYSHPRIWDSFLM